MWPFSPKTTKSEEELRLEEVRGVLNSITNACNEDPMFAVHVITLAARIARETLMSTNATTMNVGDIVTISLQEQDRDVVESNAKVANDEVA